MLGEAGFYCRGGANAVGTMQEFDSLGRIAQKCGKGYHYSGVAGIGLEGLAPCRFCFVSFALVEKSPAQRFEILRRIRQTCQQVQRITFDLRAVASFEIIVKQTVAYRAAEIGLSLATLSSASA